MHFPFDLLDSFLSHLAAQSAKAALLAAAVTALCLLLPRRWLTPAWRHVLWCLVFARLLLPDIATPGLSWEVSRWLPASLSDAAPLFARTPPPADHLPATAASPTTTELSSPSASPAVARMEVAHSGLPRQMATGTGTTIPSLPIAADVAAAGRAHILTGPRIFGLIWLCGAVLWWVAIAAACWRFRRRVLDRATAAAPKTEAALDACLRETGISRRVMVRCSAHLTTPAVCGPVRPVILIPHSVEAELSAADLRLLLLHELGHVQRRDALVQILASLLLGLHWCNPLLWLAWARLRHEAESATDAWVLRRAAPGTAPSYGGLLLDLAARASALGFALFFVPSLIGATSGCRRLRQRLAAIATHRRVDYRHSLLGGAVALLFAVAGFAQSPAPRTPTNASQDQATPPANSAPAEAGAIGGTVVDTEGRPIAGALVTVDVRAPATAPSKLPAGFRDPAPVSTDAQGRWQASGVPAGVLPSTAENIRDGHDIYTLYVAHPEFLFTSFSSSTEPISDTDSAFRQNKAKLVLKRGLTLSGVVSDAAGQPIPGATVERDLTTADHHALPATTDASGRFALKSARPGDLAVRVRAPGFATLVQLVPMRADLEQNFVLGKAHTLSLKIRDANGRPVTANREQRTQHPLVAIYPPGDRWAAGDRLWWTEAPHDDGVVTWDEAPGGELVAEIKGRGFIPVTRKVTAGGDQIVIQLAASDRLPTVTIKVTDRATGAPLNGCTFNTGSVSAGAPEHYTASWISGSMEVALRQQKNEGHYFGRLAQSQLNREVLFAVRREGYIPALTSRIIPKNGDATLEVSLEPGEPTEIQVRASDNPAAGAKVYAIWRASYGSLRNFAPGASVGQWEFSGVTDAAGRCAIPPLPGDTAVLVTHDDGFATTTIADLKRNPTLVLGLYAQVEASVRFRDGSPAPGILLEFFGTLQLPGDHSVFQTLTATSDADGRVTLPRVLPARFGHFRQPTPSSRRGHTAAMPPPGDWKKIAVGQTTRFDVVADPQQSITGRLLLPDGSPLRDTRKGSTGLQLLRPNPFSDSAANAAPGSIIATLPAGFVTLDENGRFTIENLAPGTYHLEFQRDYSSGRPAPNATYAFPGPTGTHAFTISETDPLAKDAPKAPIDLGDLNVLEKNVVKE
jgi:beta-lactamase regulating signal transducer with metallopeptidase domain/protocatechuate 3,4-dioxygenase beta subunit